jgi:hypothetical protein
VWGGADSNVTDVNESKLNSKIFDMSIFDDVDAKIAESKKVEAEKEKAIAKNKAVTAKNKAARMAIAAH